MTMLDRYHDPCLLIPFLARMTCLRRPICVNARMEVAYNVAQRLTTYQRHRVQYYNIYVVAHRPLTRPSCRVSAWKQNEAACE